MFTFDWKSLTTNVLLGYILSWVYFTIAFYLLYKVIGKVKSAFFAYATSWVVWIVASALLQKYNPLGDTLSP